MFRGVRALMYNSPEERAMIQARRRQQRCAVASSSASARKCLRTRSRTASGRSTTSAVRSPIYVGRIDENKGCRELFDYFGAYLQRPAGAADAGADWQFDSADIPSHPRIRHLGFLDDSDKFDAIAASELLIMPSYFESLSMVALEAWALGRPVLANAKCDVLKGQCIRSNAGLYYDERAGVRRDAARDRTQPLDRGQPRARTDGSTTATTTTGR